ncbi:MAG: DUF4335 domain-containing protein [Cyanobacteria bacterium P01_H01_bin.121]
MQLQRRYSLPNCTLILQGLTDTSDSVELSQTLSILMNAECYLAGEEQPLSGGRQFLASLVEAVSHYAQALLSNIQRTKLPSQDLVRLKRLDFDHHQLVVKVEEPPSPNNQTKTQPASSESKTRLVSLTTVQFFDLVEAIDQMFADPLTLPNFLLPLSPLSKQEVVQQEPLPQRVASPALGLAGLAIATAALVSMPLPELRRPTNPAAPISAESVGDSVDPTQPDTSTSDASTPDASTPETPTDPIASEQPDFRNDLPPVPEITDRQQLLQISTQLYDEINRAWINVPIFDDSLIYRVSATQDGAIIGYRGENDAADSFVDETPLPELLYSPTSTAINQAEPIAQFRVTFKPDSILEVSPWYGYPEAGQPEPQTAPDTSSSDTSPDTSSVDNSSNSATPNSAVGSATERFPEPTDAAPEVPSVPTPDTPAIAADGSDSLAGLAASIYTEIDRRWQTVPDFEDDIVYRIQVDPAGTILAAEQVSPGSAQADRELPLLSLVQADSTATESKPFRVVFKPSGVLEVSPWDGWE